MLWLATFTACAVIKHLQEIWLLRTLHRMVNRRMCPATLTVQCHSSHDLGSDGMGGGVFARRAKARSWALVTRRPSVPKDSYLLEPFALGTNSWNDPEWATCCQGLLRPVRFVVKGER